MSTRITISPRVAGIKDILNNLAGEAIEEKLLSLGNYAVEISPVWSGAFVNSWSIVPIGSGAGRSRISSFDYKGNASRLEHSERSDASKEKSTAREALANDVKSATKSIMERGGATLTNRAPHAKLVDQKYLTITRVRDRFR